MDRLHLNTRNPYHAVRRDPSVDRGGEPERRRSKPAWRIERVSAREAHVRFTHGCIGETSSDAREAEYAPGDSVGMNGAFIGGAHCSRVSLEVLGGVFSHRPSILTRIFSLFIMMMRLSGGRYGCAGTLGTYGRHQQVLG